MRESAALLRERAEQITGDKTRRRTAAALRKAARRGGANARGCPVNRAARQRGGLVLRVRNDWVAEVARDSDTGSAAYEPLKMDGASAGETGSGVAGTKLPAAGMPRSDAGLGNDSGRRGALCRLTCSARGALACIHQPVEALDLAAARRRRADHARTPFMLACGEPLCFCSSGSS